MDANSRLLRETFDAVLAAAHPRAWLTPALERLTPPARTVRVLAIGKAAVPMAETFAAVWKAAWTGLAITPSATGRPIPGFRVIEAAHPVPGEASLAAGETALAFAAAAGSDDLLLILVSGGASSLACAPIPGLTLADKAELTQRLLASGAPIDEVNAVRRSVSRLKGGGLAAASGAGRVLTLAASDVPGDALADIGSGPGVPSPTGAGEALAALDRYAPDLRARFAVAINSWAAVRPRPAGAIEARVLLPIDAGIRTAAEFLERRGRAVVDLGVLEEPVAHAVVRHLAVLKPGCVVVSGGELGVSVPAGAAGKGGRNLHFLAAFAGYLAGRRDVWALAADTDGVDGAAPAAGGWIDPETLAGLDRTICEAALSEFDSYGLLATRGRLIETGPTGVNVGDLRLVCVDQGY